MLTYIQTALNGRRSERRATRKGARERRRTKLVMGEVTWGQLTALEKTAVSNRHSLLLPCAVIVADFCILML